MGDADKTRRPLNVVIVAMANKLARIIWAMLAHQRPCRRTTKALNRPDFSGLSESYAEGMERQKLRWHSSAMTKRVGPGTH